MDRLEKHILGPSALHADRIDQQTAMILVNIDRMGATAGIISEGLDSVACYGTTAGPLYGEGAYYVWLPTYDESHGRAA